jgi:SAM-dependent methyltransferase
MSFRYVQLAQSVFSRFIVNVREKNIWTATANAIATARRQSVPSTRDSFDVELGIETSFPEPLWQLNISSPNAKFGVRYQPTEPSLFLDSLRACPAEVREFTYIDLGCGKGRTLILAAREGFQRIIGVEISSQLATIARKNISHVGILAQVIEADASQFEFPDGNLLIYMYNPFGIPIVDAVIRNLIIRTERCRDVVFVVYVNPVCHERFKSIPAFQPLVVKEELRIWRLN